jgi:hypothetical protein
MLLTRRALAAFSFLWMLTCTAAFSTCEHVGGARSATPPRTTSSTPRRSTTPQLAMTMQDLPSMVVSDVWLIPEQIPLILFTAAFYVSVRKEFGLFQKTFTTIFGGGDFIDIVRKTYAEVVAQAEKPESKMAALEMEDSYVPTELTRQEKLDLLAKAEYYEKEAVRSRAVDSGKKRSIIGRILRPWKK